MSIDFWGLGLQAINVLILMWLLSRMFWKPVAAAITRRQTESQAAMDAAAAAQTRADTALAEVEKARAGMAEERKALLDAARTEAKAATKAALAAAQSKADAMTAAALTSRDTAAETARTSNAAQAADLSLQIASTLLARLDGPAVQAAFLASLVDAVKALSVADRKALCSSPGGMKIVSPREIGKDRTAIKAALQDALGGAPDLEFKTDADLIAGLELHGPHLTLRNSWQADLAQVQKAVKDAA